MRVVIVDVDGTLVDSNYQHALAWYRSFRRIGVTLPLWRIHRHVGMGGDQIVPALTDEATDREHGDALRSGWTEEFDPMLREVAALEAAPDLLSAARDAGLDLVLASSGAPEHVEHFLDLVDGRRWAMAWTDSGDVERTKPAPDLLAVALDKIGARDHPDLEAVLVGDSVWDCRAGANAGVPVVALLTGGFSEEELREAGADEVFADLRALADAVPRLPFARSTL
jgi:beta-phosphoglucomutase-like phosphatase (HAD superfamily)